MARLFGTDGVRGQANLTLTPEIAFRIGRAHGYLLRKDNPSGRVFVVVGRDTRISGELLQYSYVCGLNSSGVDGVLLGVIPTPGVAWAIREYGAFGGCVISASHNPYSDNGIKLIGGDGYKLTDAQEDELEEYIHNCDTLPRADKEHIGSISYRQDIAEAYADYLVSVAKIKLDGLKIVLDCANGASSALAAGIFKRLGAEVIVINHEPDGININTNCGSTHPESLQKAVVANGADFGLAFDGDADRCLACDENGHMLDGDHMLMLFANRLKGQGRLNHNRLVTTVMANLGLEEACQKFGITMVRTAVGDRYVLEDMLASGAVLGGEQSGHIIFSDYATTGDGMLTGIMLAQVAAEAQKSLSTLAQVVIKKPQYLLNVRVKDKNNWDSAPSVKAKVKEVEDKLKGRGRLLIRPSGTENLLRIMAEGPDIEELKNLIGSIAEIVKNS